MKSDGSQESLRVFLRFDPDFRELLYYGRAGDYFEKRTGHATSLKDIVESCGVPHTEIGALRLNGAPAWFSTRIADGDRIDVLPLRSPLFSECSLQPSPPQFPRFIADIHLGRMARRLRLLGFDTLWFTGQHDREMLDIMEEEGRILLTRDRRLLMNNRVLHGCCIRSGRVLEQVVQVICRYCLASEARPFSRCLVCNGMLEDRPKETLSASLPEKTRRYYDEFRVCSSCGKVYWQGAHMRRLSDFVEAALSGGDDSEV
ncbi:MAG: Mut7-C ubiquitin/RNAse domain-containing protein [Chlorobiales bacterium]|nr:Mut7-C ubiquitin/RNAse domain-containing protein [Chlorobiales bacterium]